MHHAAADRKTAGRQHPDRSSPTPPLHPRRGTGSRTQTQTNNVGDYCSMHYNNTNAPRRKRGGLPVG